MNRLFDAGPRARPWLIALFVLVNGIVLSNAIRHPPQVGYDAAAHLVYVEVLSHGRLPAPDDTHEYFSPPLAYVAPALVRAGGASLLAAAKTGQLVNVLVSIALSLLLLRTCQIVRPGNAAMKLTSLALLGLIGVYPKTFAQVRGEPWVALLALAIANEALLCTTTRRSVRDALRLGVMCGAILLARQWGVLAIGGCVLFAVVLAVHRPSERTALARQFAIAAVIAIAMAGYYYAKLWSYPTIFPRETPGFSLGNQPRDFYLGTGNGLLFSRPVRPSFPNQVIPMFYSDLWGDYWCYFLVFERDPPSGKILYGPFLSNVPERARYLGRVNLVGLMPALFFLAAIAFGSIQLARMLVRPVAVTLPDAQSALGFAIVLVSVVGYGCFLILYPNHGKGDTIKATYLLHILPFVALMSADVMARLRERSRAGFAAIAVLLVLAALHNLPTLFTSFGGVTSADLP